MPGKGRWPKTSQDTAPGDMALLIMEWLAEQGINALLKVDPVRLAEDGRPWTFIASGGPVPDFVRAEAATPELCVSMVVARLREVGVDVPY